MSLQTAGSLALLTLYLLIVRSLCWRRYNALHKKYTGKKSTLTPEEAQEIVQLVFEWDMPILSEYSLAFALFKTYAIPTISSLLLTTGQLSIPATVARLYADTEILIATWMVCPLAGKLVDTKPEAPADDPRASLALARVNWLHGKYKIKWAKQYGWRPHSDLECHASFVYWSEIGRKMNITNIPPTAEAFQAWIEEYEAEHILPAESNRDVATYTTNELLFPVPHALGIRAFAEGFTRAMLDKPTRIAMMYLWMSLDSISAVLRLVQREFTGNRPPQHKYAPAVIQSLLNIVAFVQKHLLLPRRKPAAAVKSELPPLVRTEGGEIAPRLYPKWTSMPWYKPAGRTSIGYIRDRVQVLFNWHDDVPKPEYRSSGYGLHEMGPLPFEQSGHDEVMRMAEAIQGCPIANAWSAERAKKVEGGN
ncbi:hypothetical protein C8F01DRAFT_1146371 [Mycena amicta]|nr:hypothetical protein C8F01DRAFT_1146371 [Mycena amicta]